MVQPISFPFFNQFQHYSSFSHSLYTTEFFILSVQFTAPTFSISTSQMLPLVFVHSVVVSTSLHLTTLHSTQSTSLASFLVFFFPRVRRKFFSSCWKLLLQLLSSALLLDNSSCCYWYYTPSIWSYPLIRRIHLHGRLARWIKWRACDVGEAKEELENEMWRRWSNGRVGEWDVT